MVCGSGRGTPMRDDAKICTRKKKNARGRRNMPVLPVSCFTCLLLAASSHLHIEQFEVRAKRKKKAKVQSLLLLLNELLATKSALTGVRHIKEAILISVLLVHLRHEGGGRWKTVGDEQKNGLLSG
jgi:hypothetical protein